MHSDGTRVFEVRHPLNADGKRPFEVVGTRLDAAKARAREIYAARDKGGQVTRIGTTLKEVVADWRSVRDIKPRSAESFDYVLDRHIVPVLGSKKVKDLTPLDLVKWLQGLRRRNGKPGPLADSTKRQCLVVLNVVLAHAVEMGALNAVPRLDHKQKPKMGEPRKRIVSVDEEKALLDACGGYTWLRPMIEVTLHQALRQGEVAGLTWEDVDFDNGMLTVRHQFTREGQLGPTKGGKVCSIPLTDHARKVLREHQLASGGREGYVFRNSLGRPRCLKDISRAFGKVRERAGLDDGELCFHSLRHTGISRLANHPQIPLVQVKNFARHTSLMVTQGYVHAIENAEVATLIAQATVAM
jgi:integrase